MRLLQLGEEFLGLLGAGKDLLGGAEPCISIVFADALDGEDHLLPTCARLYIKDQHALAHRPGGFHSLLNICRYSKNIGSVIGNLKAFALEHLGKTLHQHLCGSLGDVPRHLDAERLGRCHHNAHTQNCKRNEKTSHTIYIMYN